jgi:hypothetical protein
MYSPVRGFNLPPLMSVIMVLLKKIKACNLNTGVLEIAPGI